MNTADQGSRSVRRIGFFLLACAAGLTADGCRRTAQPVAAVALAGSQLAEQSKAQAALAPAAAAPPVEFLIGKGAAMGRRRYAAAAPVLAGAPAAPPRSPPSQSPPPLDPNARYATTYRPGAAALGAFDEALARGAIPPIYRDLVGDFGVRYAPALPAPDKGALVVQVDTERAAMAPAGGTLHLRVALRSHPGRELHRARLSVAVALDVSGSMQGAPIDNARAAAAALVRRLDDGDLFALCTFSNDAQVLVAGGPVGPRRARILADIAGIRAEGGTNISAGLDLAYQQAARHPAQTEVLPIVMLLSDGQATAGDTDPAALAARSALAFQDGVQTSAFGLGDSFDAALLSAIADHGAGGYYYLARPHEIAAAFARELDARLVPAALAVELRVRLRPDVKPLKVYGSRQLDQIEAAQVRAQEIDADQQAQHREHITRDRQADAVGGMRFFMPSFARDDHYALLLNLELPPGLAARPIASVEVRYKDRLLGRNVTQEIPVRVRYGASEAESAATIDASVLRTVQAFAAGDAILRAAGQVDTGDRTGAARLLRERADLLAGAARRLTEPRFADDSRRLARLAEAVGGVPDPLALALLLRGSGSGYLR